MICSANFGIFIFSYHSIDVTIDGYPQLTQGDTVASPAAKQDVTNSEFFVVTHSAKQSPIKVLLVGSSLDTVALTNNQFEQIYYHPVRTRSQINHVTEVMSS